MAQAKGFFTDTSVCIGCKACEVACKEWNELTGNPPAFLADSFDTTGKPAAENWRHVKFIEGDRLTAATTAGDGQAWLMMSDVCKHCQQASCAEVCPTNAIIRTEFDTVFIQQDTCNGCRNCIAACPYGVIGLREKTGAARRRSPSRSRSGRWPAAEEVRPDAARGPLHAAGGMALVHPGLLPAGRPGRRLLHAGHDAAALGPAVGRAGGAPVLPAGAPS